MLKSSILVTLLSLTVSIVSFFNQTLIASFFGAGHLMDIYLTISSVPILTAALITAGLSYYLTPFLIKLKAEDTSDYRYAYGNLFVIIMIFSLAICLIVLCGFSFALTYVYPNLLTVNKQLIFNIGIFTWLNTLLSIAIGFYNSLLNASKRFLIPVVISFFPYLGVIVCCVFFAGLLSVLAISVGLLLGSCVGVSIAVWIGKNDIRIRFKSFDVSRFNFFLKHLPLVMIAMLSFSVYQSIDSFWATRLGSSNLSYLGYCQRILVAVGALVITGPSTVLIPHLTDAIIQGREEDFYRLTSSVIKIIISLAAFIAIVGSVLSYPVTQIMFERGKFTSVDTANVAALLPYMLTGMVFMLSVVLLFRVLFVKEKIYAVAGLGFGCAFLYFMFSGLSVKLGGDVHGIGLSYLCTWLIILATALIIIFKHNKSYFFNYDSARYFFLLTINLLIIYLVSNRLFKFMDGLHMAFKYNNLIICFCVGVTATIFFVTLTTQLFKLNDLRQFFTKIIKWK